MRITAALCGLALAACVAPKDGNGGDAATVAAPPVSSAGAGAGAGANAGAGAGASAGAGAGAGASAGARMAQWEAARKGALTIPCRAIAVDGAVDADPSGTTGGDAGAGSAAGGPVLLHGEIPGDTWLTLASNGRLVAKDPRTTRETAFVGPARVRPCVAHREESWIASGRFESAMGAGETPGAEEWVVTPFAVARYAVAELQMETRPKGAIVTLGNGVAFLWLDADARVRPAARPSGDAGPAAATTTLDDDGWQRMTAGSLTIVASDGSATGRARSATDRCVALSGEARDLAAELLAGAARLDATAAKNQVRTRRIARAACALAALRDELLPPSTVKTHVLAQLEAARTAPSPPSPSARAVPSAP